MFNIPFVNRVSFLFFYLMSFQELLSDSLFTGIVLSSKTKQPISNVNIYTNQKSKGTSTNIAGEFSLQISNSDTVIIYEHVGFEILSQSIQLESKKNTVYLDPKVISFSELKVIGENETGRFKNLETKNMVSDIAVKDFSFRTYSDIGDVLMNEESVLIDESSRGVKVVSIRGARQEEMSFLYDGVPIYHDGRSVMDVSMFDIGSMDQVEVLRGGNEMFPGSSGSINFVPSINYGNSMSLYQRFGTYNTGNFNGGLSLGNDVLSLNIGSGKSKSVQYYEDIIDSDIIQSSNNNYINIGYRPALDLELKLSHIKNTRAFKNYYSLDSSNSNNEISTFKIEKSSKKYGSIELYFSDQISSGEDKISIFQSNRNDKRLLTGLHYKYYHNNVFFRLNTKHSKASSNWEQDGNELSIDRKDIAFSSVFGVSQKKSKPGFEMKDFILSINTNNIEDRKNNESDLVYNANWENSGVNFLFSAWEHLDNSIIYVYSNVGNSFRTPSISERYSHAFRPAEWVSDSLLVENKMMREIGIKITSTGKKLSPHFQGSMSYFSYLYKNKIKSIQYSASSMLFPLNNGDANISGVELNAELLDVAKIFNFRSIYSAYTYSDQLSFPMQPLNMLRNSIEFNLGSFKAKVTFKSEGSRVLTTIGEEGLLENNYLDKYQSYDLHGSYILNYRDFDISVAIFGQNIGDNSQVLDGISIFDKRMYLSLGLQWN